jgi:hypothetical protein
MPQRIPLIPVWKSMLHYDLTGKRINETFKSVRNGVVNLETQIGQVANTAVKIGAQLENIDNQRNRAIEAMELLSYFLEFSKGPSVSN